jgi:hypothetical protein
MESPHLAVDWPNSLEAERRYDWMLRITTPRDCTLLDLGCGLAGLKVHIDGEELRHISYTGLDISPKFVAACKERCPGVEFLCHDILTDPPSRKWDWVICNGVLTEKRALSFIDMWTYTQEFLKAAWNLCERGLAFNVMSSYVDYQKDFLFHLPVETAITFICENLSRRFVVNHMNYGLYEYMMFVYR